jgi:hypothetical protein
MLFNYRSRKIMAIPIQDRLPVGKRPFGQNGGRLCSPFIHCGFQVIQFSDAWAILKVTIWIPDLSGILIPIALYFNLIMYKCMFSTTSFSTGTPVGFNRQFKVIFHNCRWLYGYTQRPQIWNNQPLLWRAWTSISFWFKGHLSHSLGCGQWKGSLQAEGSQGPDHTGKIFAQYLKVSIKSLDTFKSEGLGLEWH